MSLVILINFEFQQNDTMPVPCRNESLRAVFIATALFLSYDTPNVLSTGELP
jgi:hypothetical protein